MNGIVFSCIIILGNVAVAYEMDKSEIVKRQSDEVVVYTVELLIVVDFTVYQYWLEQTLQDLESPEDKETDVENRIYKHYQAVVNGINTRFSSIDNLVFAIDVAITDIIILKNRSEAMWAGYHQNGQSLDAPQTLSSFRKWTQMAPDLPGHDHAMLFTRYDLTKDGSDAVAGLAFTSSMCTHTSLSIVEDRMSSQSYTVASHEIAHSLGARHDGTINRCSSEDNFIMSEVTSVTGNLQKNRNSWRFSECSVEYFSEYIGKLNVHGTNCLIHRDGEDDKEASFSDVTSNVSETVPSPDQQCERVQGDSSFLCRNLYRENYTDFCALMYCSLDDVTCNFRLPLDGTTCGNNKICKAGYCVFQNAVVSNSSVHFSDKCPFGDQPGVLKASNQDCTGSVVHTPYLCYQEFYTARCCRSCEQAHTSVLGCEYGDKEERCKTITYIDCILGEEACCTTCASYKETLKELIMPVSAGGATVVVLVILMLVIVLVRKYRRCPGKEDAESQTDTTIDRQNEQNIRLSQRDSRRGYANDAFQDSSSSAMNGFRVPGSRHEPMFQYDRQAKLMLSTMLANKDSASPASPYGGNGIIFPGSDVIYQAPPAWPQFNLREFGGGRRPFQAITDTNNR